MAKVHKGASLHHWLRAGIAGGFCCLIVRLVQADTLHYYIAPRMELYVKLSALGLFVLAAFQLFSAIRAAGSRPACTCVHGEESGGFRPLGYALFLLPLVLGFALPDAIMASDIAAVKGMQLSAASTAGQDQAPAPRPDAVPMEEPLTRDADLAALFPSDAYTGNIAELGMKLYRQDSITVKEEGFMEILTTIDMYRANFMGKSIRISGFVYREEGMPENRFIVSRLAMQCCSADSTPYGVMVRSEEAPAYSKDTWLEVVGTIGETRYNNKEIILIDAHKIEVTEAPESPYVYPYFDDFSKLAE